MATDAGWYVVQSGNGYNVRYYKTSPPASIWSEGPYPSQSDADLAEQGAPQNSEANPHTTRNQKSIKNKNTPGNTIDLNPFSWFGSVGGSIASGLEQGFVSLIKDVWRVAQPFVEIGIAVTILLIVLRIFFNPEISQVNSAAATAILAAA